MQRAHIWPLSFSPTPRLQLHQLRGGEGARRGHPDRHIPDKEPRLPALVQELMGRERRWKGRWGNWSSPSSAPPPWHLVPPQALAAAAVAFGRERVPLSEETLASCFAAPQD